jgi:hypothetical protein
MELKYKCVCLSLKMGGLNDKLKKTRLTVGENRD